MDSGKAVFAIAATAVTVVAAIAQQTATPITLYVVANEKSGAPVSGLQKQDFTVLDNGQPQQLTGFQAVTGDNSDAEIVLVLDAVNTSFTRVAFARTQIDKFLKQEGGRLAQPVSIGIFTDAGLDMQPTGSRDGNALAAYMDQKETGLRASNRSQGFYGAADRSQFSLRALQELSAFEQKRPGRKLVIWLSPGWALLSGPRIQLSAKDQQQIYQSVAGISDELREAGITLYMVDPAGTAGDIGLRDFYYEQFLKPLTKPKDALFGDLALQVFAVHSGGRVLNASNDVAAEIARCARDANDYYVLTFNAAPSDGPGVYNAIQVKIANSKIKPQTISGYYSQP